MKVVKYFLGLSLLLLVSCSDEFNNGDINKYTPDIKQHYLYVSSTNVELEAAEASTKTINVQASETPWGFKGMAPWLTVSPTSGSSDASITLTAKANLSGDEMRTSVFTLAATEPDVNINYSVSATQRTAQPYVNLSATDLVFYASEASQTIQVTSNVHWKMSDVTAYKDWLKVSVAPDSSSITFTVSENAAFSGHQTSLNFYDKYYTLLNTIYITQRTPDYPELETSELEVDADGGSYSLSLTSQVAWSAEVWYSQKTTDWIRVTPSSGKAGTTNLTITLLPNTTLSERAGHIYVWIGDRRTADLIIKQKGLYMTVEPKELTFDASQDTQNVTIESNAPWTVLSKPKWVTVSDSIGKGSKTLKLQAEPNWGTVERSGVLKLGITGTSHVATVALKQGSRFFDELTETLLQFSSLQETKSVEVNTDGRWGATVDAGNESWISLLPNSWSGSGTLMITVQENTSADERVGQVYVTVDDRTQTIIIVQRGKYFTVLPNAGEELPASGGSHKVHITTDDTWTATTPSSWMTLSATEGKGDIDLTLTASSNNSITARADTTVIAPASTQPIRIVTHQAGHFMTVDATALCFFAEGKLTGAIHVASDAEFTVTAEDNSWFNWSREGNEITVTADKNESGQKREGKLVLKMTGLPQGEEYNIEIPVIQTDASSGVVVIPFGEDQQWDLTEEGEIVIRVTGFSEDKDWNDVYSGKLVIKVSTFSDDSNWD